MDAALDNILNKMRYARNKIDGGLRLMDEATKELELFEKGIDATEEPKEVQEARVEAQRKVELEEVRKVLITLTRKDMRLQVKELLTKYGAEKLSSVKPVTLYIIFSKILSLHPFYVIHFLKVFQYLVIFLILFLVPFD